MAMGPEHYLPGQEADEQIDLFLRQHPISQLGLIVTGIVGLLLPLGILAGLGPLGVDLGLEPARNFAVTLIPAYYLVLLTYLYIRWLNYYLDVIIITNRRIVDIDQIGMLNRQISELSTHTVQDSRANKKGILQTFFDFGDVLVETAGENQNFVFDNVPHPNAVAQTVINLGEGREQNEDLVEAVSQLKDVAEKQAEKQEEAVEVLKDNAAPNSEPQPATAAPEPPKPASQPTPAAAKPTGSKPAAQSTPAVGDPFVRPGDDDWQEIPREPE